MCAPEFWMRDDGLGALLAPLGAVHVLAVAARIRFAKPWRAPVPVFCAGNLTLGGAGKTPTVAALVAALKVLGRKPAILSRGYGGSERGPLRVDPAAHDAARVGDEPLLLASLAAVHVGADRAASARQAIADGADVLVMDDGFQNPGLAKDCALIVVDGAAGFGNGYVFPAGPLREPVAAGAARARACVVIGEDRFAAGPATGLPVLRADLVAEANDLSGVRVLAFAGIGRPAKFFDTLKGIGADIAATREFADHHPYSAAEIAALHAEAKHLGARLVTTRKDLVRLPAASRAGISALDVSLRFADPSAFGRLVDAGLARC